MDWEVIYARLQADREDPDAWATLETLVQRRARRDLAHRGWHVTTDVVADTCASVALSLEQARGAETFRGFVLGHYLNARRRALRATSGPSISLDGLDLPVPPAEPDEGPDPETLSRLMRALEQLPARERAAVALRYFEAMTTAGIGRALGTSEGNARQILFRGINRLRRDLRAPCGPGSRGESADAGRVQWKRHGPGPTARHAVPPMARLVAGDTIHAPARD